MEKQRIIDALALLDLVEELDYYFDENDLPISLTDQEIPSLETLESIIFDHEERLRYDALRLRWDALGDVVGIIGMLGLIAQYPNSEIYFKYIFQTNDIVALEALENAKVDYEFSVDQENTNQQALKFLAESDWKVLRHIRQKALGEVTSLTEEQYLQLELERSIKANSIIR